MSAAEMQAHVKKWYLWSDALMAKGHSLQGQPLADRGRTIRGKDRSITDGPYAPHLPANEIALAIGTLNGDIQRLSVALLARCASGAGSAMS
jgi:hypothetical protein